MKIHFRGTHLSMTIENFESNFQPFANSSGQITKKNPYAVEVRLFGSTEHDSTWQMLEDVV